MYSNSKQEMTNNDVIMCQYISTLKKQNIHDGDVTPLAEKEVQLRYATWTNLYKSSLLLIDFVGIKIFIIASAKMFWLEVHEDWKSAANIFHGFDCTKKNLEKKFTG